MKNDKIESCNLPDNVISVKRNYKVILCARD